MEREALRPGPLGDLPGTQVRVRPRRLLNPGQVVGVDAGEVESGAMPERARTVDTTENLRVRPEDEFDAGFDPALEWDNDNGMQGMVELCHGCGGCRGPQETTGGVMCPTFRAEEEEILSTRGRSNMLRQAMSGDLSPEEQFEDEFVEEVTDLCIGCKGCMKDCPSGVDMAKMKAEVTHEYHQRNGSSLRDKMFANIDTLSTRERVSHRSRTSRERARRTIGAGEDGRYRPRPHAAELPAHDAAGLVRRTRPAYPGGRSRATGTAVPRYVHELQPSRGGKAAVRALEAAGVHVPLADRTDSGRPAHSKGFRGPARATERDIIDALVPAVKEGWDVLLLEPCDGGYYRTG